MIRRLVRWARAIKRDALALYLASRDRGTPWHAKGLALIVVAYAFSPIDLIPDFIPILSGALVAKVELLDRSDDEKNALCTPVPIPDKPSDWPVSVSVALQARRWRK